MLLNNAPTGVVKAFRRAAGTNTVEFGYVPGTETEFDVPFADVQPISGSDVRNIPERLQAFARYKMYVPQNVDLRVAYNPITGELIKDALPDLVEYRGVRYRLYATNQYPFFLLQHARFFLILPETNEPRPDGLNSGGA